MLNWWTRYKRWLRNRDLYRYQRPIDQDHVRRIAKNFDPALAIPIVIQDGRVIDGQHRLEAFLQQKREGEDT